MVTFYMGNGGQLTTSHYFKIKTEPRAPIRDATGSEMFGPGNSPCSHNRMVSVTVADSDTSNRQSDNTNGCGCGSGIALAFMPPGIFSATRLLKRRKKQRKTEVSQG
jgi:hypothetical protein